MDIFVLLRAIRAEWSAVTAHPEVFAAIGCLGLLFGWSAAWLILKQRLAHHRELVDHYKDVLTEKAPALVRSQQNLAPHGVSGLRFLGFGALLIALGYVAAVFFQLPPAGVARMSKLQFSNLEVVTNKDPITFNIYIQNTGNLAAFGLVHSDGAVLLDHEASDDELDGAFKALSESAASFKVRPQSEIQPSQIVWYTLPYAVSAADFAKVMKGPSYLYLFVRLSSRDIALPPGKESVTEMCLFTFHGQGVHECPRHNRIYRQ